MTLQCTQVSRSPKKRFCVCVNYNLLFSYEIQTNGNGKSSIPTIIVCPLSVIQSGENNKDQKNLKGPIGKLEIIVVRAPLASVTALFITEGTES